ncbi:MAG: heptaprenylglyceryl phosphate synthase [bacterium]
MDRLNWRTWRHLTKLDPDKPLSPTVAARVAASGTDAVVIGGTQNITAANVAHLLTLLAPYPLPKIVEISTFDAIVPGADGYLIPVVLNTTDVRWLIGAHQAAARRLGSFLDWQLTLPEGYLVLNENSAVARLTASNCRLSLPDAIAFARCADGLFRLPVVYLEYSGRYGDPALVKAVKANLTAARLFYGGGIDGPARAAEMGRIADTIVVGNLIYESGLDLLPATVQAVQNK